MLIRYNKFKEIVPISDDEEDDGDEVEISENFNNDKETTPKTEIENDITKYISKSKNRKHKKAKVTMSSANIVP